MALEGLANIKFDYIDIWDGYTIVASEEETNFPASNTQTRRKSQTWKFDATAGDVTGKINGSALSVWGVFIINSNFTAAATVKFQGSDNDFVATPLDQALTQSTDGFNWVHIFDSLQTYDDLQVLINDATNPDDLQYIGRIWLGVFYEPPIGYSDKSEPDGKIVDPSVVSESDGGQVATIQKEKFKDYFIDFDTLDGRDDFDAMIEEVGTSKELVFVKKPKSDNLTQTYENPEDNFVYARITKYNIRQKIAPFFTANLSLREER